MLVNTRKKSLSLVLGTVMTLGFFASPVMAQTHIKAKTKITSPSKVSWKKLGLNTKQKVKINKLLLKYNKSAIKLKAEIKIKRIEIQEALISPAINPNTLHKLLQTKLVLESKLQKAQLNNFLAIKKVLTPTQLKKLPQAIVLR